MPADSVAAFRIGFGLLVAFSSIRFLAKGWVETLYLAPDQHLTYRWFGWVEPLPAPAKYAWLAGLAVLGLCIAAGWHTRLALGLFIVGFGYTELIDAALYLNHYWFMTLAAVTLLLLPVGGLWSADAAAGRVAGISHVPAWVVWVLRAQVGSVYVFAGIAKLNPDWLFEAQPLSIWFAARSDGVLGPLLTLPGAAHGASWFGALFDCTIVGWLLWRRSRPWAYAGLVVFHLATGALFAIGVFPWVMIVSALIFFDPDWPRRLVGRPAPAPRQSSVAVAGRGAVVALGLFAVLQLALPLRHYAEDSNVRWSEEGYLLSWRVMLTEKAGTAEFEVTDPNSGRSWLVDPGEVLEDWQAATAVTRPDLIHGTAHLIAERYDEPGRDVQVRVQAWVSMNGEPARRIIDPAVDLAAHPRGEVPAGWILPGP
ncbi:MAG: HTTM domain-containing protein [Actinomycetota bacterium]